MSKNSNEVIKRIMDDVVMDWVSSFLWFCWPEHGISPGEAATVISSVIEDYLKSCLQNLPHHFPDAEALASKFDFVPNQTVQNDGDGGCL